FLVLLVVRRMAHAREARRRFALEERLRPLALRLLDEDAEPPSADLPPEEAALFAELLGRYGRSLRGSAAERMQQWFAASGALRARRCSRSAHRRCRDCCRSSVRRMRASGRLR